MPSGALSLGQQFLSVITGSDTLTAVLATSATLQPSSTELHL